MIHTGEDSISVQTMEIWEYYSSCSHGIAAICFDTQHFGTLQWVQEGGSSSSYLHCKQDLHFSVRYSEVIWKTNRTYFGSVLAFCSFHWHIQHDVHVHAPLDIHVHTGNPFTQKMWPFAGQHLFQSVLSVPFHMCQSARPSPSAARWILLSSCRRNELAAGLALLEF